MIIVRVWMSEGYTADAAATSSATSPFSAKIVNVKIALIGPNSCSYSLQAPSKLFLVEAGRQVFSVASSAESARPGWRVGRFQ